MRMSRPSQSGTSNEERVKMEYMFVAGIAWFAIVLLRIKNR